MSDHKDEARKLSEIAQDNSFKGETAVAAALSDAYARGLVKGLAWAREIAGTMAERPYDNEPEFSAVLHVEAAISACLSAIDADAPLSPPKGPSK